MPQPTIMLVDDEPQITYLVAQKFRGAGFQVVIGSDGEEGVELALEHNVDMIVSDLQMPYMSGLEMAAELRQHEATRDIPIVILTARGYVMDSELVEQAKISRVYPKPFSVNELLACVNEMLRLVDSNSGREAA